jgi:hypothetical protein
MLKSSASICAALILAAAAFSAPAQAQFSGQVGGGGHVGGAGVGGGHFGGARVGGAHFGGARVGGAHFGGARVARGGHYYGAGYGGYGGPYYGGGYYDSGWDWGGLAAGMILGGVLAAQSSYADSVGYCMRRFKSYDPSSGTYLGYDGYRHACP